MDITDVLEAVTSSSELARMTSHDVRWVKRQTRHLGLTPGYTVDERQWSRADALTLILLARLQAAFGETSSRPFTLVANADVASLLRSPSRGAVLPTSTSGLLLAVGVPALAELVAP